MVTIIIIENNNYDYDEIDSDVFQVRAFTYVW